MLFAGLLLTLLAILSTRYIVEQQADAFGRELARRLARQITPVLASGDLILLEVKLEQLWESENLLRLAVVDVEQRSLGQAGPGQVAEGNPFRAPIRIGQNIAGEVVATLPAPAVLGDVQAMMLGMLVLATLLGIFAATLSGNRARILSQRIKALTADLEVDDSANGDGEIRDELSRLKFAVEQLPLDLLKPPTAARTSTADYRDAGLLFLHLDSLAQHVETLDEASLLKYTGFHRRLFSAAADLYDGRLSVARQFGVLISFSSAHNVGSPAFRAVSCGWLIRACTEILNPELSLRIKLSMACGLSETGMGSAQDLYPDLYNQHLIDELARRVGNESLLLTGPVAADPEVANRCELRERDGNCLVRGFMEPYCNLLERQQELVLRELRQ